MPHVSEADTVLIDKKGHEYPPNSDTDSDVRYAVVCTTPDEYRIGAVHFPGPGSGWNHSEIFTSFRTTFAKRGVYVVGGDWNMSPREPSTYNVYHSGDPTTFNIRGELCSNYDWVIVRRNFDNCRNKFRTYQDFINAEEAHSLTDHVPIYLKFKF